jgi:pimeloyl-ACP methyl ester carboxylesterase
VRIVKWIAVSLVVLLAAGVLAIAAFTHFAPEQATRLAIQGERQRAGLVRRQVELPGGLQLVYLEGGRGEPLMLLHGFGANKDNFTRVARWLTPHYRVIVPDQLGFGESAHPPEADYGPVAQAERAHALAQALGLQGVHVGGSSMGEHIALTYAALHPGEVRSLWLLDSGGVWSAPESELRRVIRETGRNPLMAENEDQFARLFGFVMSDPPYIPRPMLDVMARERIANHALEGRIFKQLVADSVEQRAAGLAVPALIVWGEQDRAIHVGTADVLHRLMPRSQVIVMPGVGHLPMVEQPRRSAEDYLRFRAALAPVAAPQAAPASSR